MAKKTEEKKVKPADTLGELKKQIEKLRGELLTIRLEQAQSKLKNTSSLTLKRKEIARLLTTLRILELTK